MDGLETRVDFTRSQQIELKQRQQELEKPVNHRLATLESGQAQLRTEQAQLRTEQAGMDERMDGLETRVDFTRSHQIELKQRQHELEKQVVAWVNFETGVALGTHLLKFQGNTSLSTLFHHSNTSNYNRALRADQYEALRTTQPEAPLVKYVEAMDFCLLEVLPKNLDENKLDEKKEPIWSWSYRGIVGKNCPELFEIFKHKESPYSDKAYMCSSASVDVALDFAVDKHDWASSRPIILYIHHISGLHIKEYVGNDYKHEEEVLFPRNIQFEKREWRFVSRTWRGHKVLCMEVHLVEVGVAVAGRS